MAPSLGEWKHRIQIVKLHLKIDFASHPNRAEGLGKHEYII